MTEFISYVWAKEMIQVINSVTPADVFALNSDDGQYIESYIARKILAKFREAKFAVFSKDLNFYFVQSKESDKKGLILDFRLIDTNDTILNFYNEEFEV